MKIYTIFFRHSSNSKYVKDKYFVKYIECNWSDNLQENHFTVSTEFRNLKV